LHAQIYQPHWDSVDKQKVPEWFVDAKFCIFIHNKYYQGKWDTLPDFDKLKSETTGICYGTNFQYMNSIPDYVGMVFNTNLHIAKEATFTFYLASDDGSRLLIDGKRLIDNDGTHATIEKTAVILFYRDDTI
jgi:hypothetical protein